jgi:SAM-dependent methyltransferase
MLLRPLESAAHDRQGGGLRVSAGNDDELGFGVAKVGDMAANSELSVAERLVQLLRHLGIAQAHVAGRLAADWSGLAATHPELVASLTLICPTDPPPPVLRVLASRLLVFTGDQGAPAEAVRKAAALLPEARLVTLHDYFGHPRADVVADHAEVIGHTMLAFLARRDHEHPLKPLASPEGEGEIAGITYRVHGAGPPLVLLPLGLAPSQWDALLPRLSARYGTIVLGGAVLGSVASLEARGRSAGYLGVVRSLIEETDLRPGETILDVGCGTGVLDRWLARRTRGANRLVAVDIHRTLLREARSLARQEGLEEAITFQVGNAEALPFRDHSFDVVMSATVMELLDADRMLREMIRVAKPGGRVAVVVRAVDLRSVVNLPLPPTIKAKVEALPNGVAGPRGCADASLYRRFRQAGLDDVRMFPQWATYMDEARLHGFHERILAALSPAEVEEWRVAVEQAQKEGTFFVALPFHCAVGTKRA